MKQNLSSILGGENDVRVIYRDMSDHEDYALLKKL